MVKITCLDHLEQVPEKEVVPYIRNLLEHILEEYKDYCPNGLEAIGAIFYIESELDWYNHIQMGLCEPVKAERFEWIEIIQEKYALGTIVIDNDRAISLCGLRSNFEKFLEE